MVNEVKLFHTSVSHLTPLPKVVDIEGIKGFEETVFLSKDSKCPIRAIFAEKPNKTTQKKMEEIKAKKYCSITISKGRGEKETILVRIDDLSKLLKLNEDEIIELAKDHQIQQKISEWTSLEPTEEQISFLAKRETGLSRDEAIEILRFSNHLRQNARNALQMLGLSSDIRDKIQGEGIYLSKEETGLPRSIFVKEEGELQVYVLLKGHGIKKLGSGQFKQASLAITTDGKLLVNLSGKLGTRLAVDNLLGVEEKGVRRSIEREVFEKITDTHPYLLKCYGFIPIYTHKKTPKIGFLMEQCELGELSPEIVKGLTDKERMQFVIKILKGVKDLHDLGYVHLDLKLPNILVTKNDKGVLEPRISDFGTAKAIGSNPGRKDKPGTIAMQPPEFAFFSVTKGMLEKRGFNVDKFDEYKGSYQPSSDTFSIAGSIYCMLSGVKKPPWLTEFENLTAKKGFGPVGYAIFMWEKISGDQGALGIKEPTENTMEHIIYEMLHPDPSQRLNLDTAIQQLEAMIIS